MKMTFRWYGENDSITPAQMRHDHRLAMDEALELAQQLTTELLKKAYRL